jgi:hypothetical protein
MTSQAANAKDPPAEKKRSPEELEDELDESIAESFPASDPPAWVNEARVGTPRRDEPRKDGIPGPSER